MHEGKKVREARLDILSSGPRS